MGRILREPRVLLGEQFRLLFTDAIRNVNVHERAHARRRIHMKAHFACNKDATINVHVRLRSKLTFFGITLMISRCTSSIFFRRSEIHEKKFSKKHTSLSHGHFTFYSFTLRSHESEEYTREKEWLPFRTSGINISFYFTLIEAYLGCKAP